MEQSHVSNRCQIVSIHGIQCVECGSNICSCGQCRCREVFFHCELQQREREYYERKFVELLRYFIGVGVPNLSPQDEDLSKLEDVAHMGFSNGGVIYWIYYYVNGLTIELSPEYIAFHEPQTRQGSNGTDSEEGHEPILGIVNSSSDKAVQQLTITSRFLHVRVTHRPQSQNVLLSILGNNLDWQRILHDVEDKTLELRWQFYTSNSLIFIYDPPGDQDVIYDPPGDQDDHSVVSSSDAPMESSIDESELEEDGDSQEGMLYSFSEEEYEWINEFEDGHQHTVPASQSAIENLVTQIICVDQVTSENAICIICTDVVPVGEAAKQLPCNHLYHSHCIIEWLNRRNTCPLCRYELPTDEPDTQE